MPLYDYSCEQCGSHFEKRLSFSDDPASVICPNGHREIRRVYLAPSVVFKGSGWYSTDHRSGNQTSGSTESGN
jgi:putative FmdB family regulatory protein